MAVANGTTFFSRFTMKFVEVIGAGIATAVTGYLIAHLGGFWSTPRTPAAIPASVEMAPAPAVSAIPKSARVSPPPMPVAVDVTSPAAKLEKPPEQPPVKPDAFAEKEPAAAPTPPARAAIPARKSNAGEPKSHELKESHEPKESHELKASEPKLRERDDTASVEEQVRAALAKVDAGRRPQPEPAAPIESPAVMPNVAVEPPPAVAAPIAPSVATLPPPPAATAVSAASPPTAIAPPLVGTVEIKSEPVATVDAVPAAAPPDNGKSKDRGFLATIEHIPDMLRPTAGATTAEPPRPPMPVGQ
jgi:hypothetical protein